MDTDIGVQRVNTYGNIENFCVFVWNKERFFFSQWQTLTRNWEKRVQSYLDCISLKYPLRSCFKSGKLSFVSYR